MNARIDRGGGIVPAANNAVDEHEHAWFENRGIGTDGCDAGDGAGAGDERYGKG